MLILGRVKNAIFSLERDNQVLVSATEVLPAMSIIYMRIYPTSCHHEEQQHALAQATPFIYTAYMRYCYS